MNTYNLPKEPAGPVWDKEGNEWRKSSGLARYWTRGKRHRHWGVLLDEGGPLSDVPPVEVGDKVSLTEFSKMPNHSVAGRRRGVFINFEGGVSTGRPGWEVDLSEVGDDEVTVLRVGGDDELPQTD